MSQKLFVGGLSYSTSEEALFNVFAEVGDVVSAKIIFDRETNQSKGFGFVEMGSPDEAKNAISQFDGMELDGRRIAVSEARPQAPRRDRNQGNFNRGQW